MKTAISLNDSLMVEADRVAREIGVSRSRLFSLALKHYLEILEKKKILERLNRLYGSEPDAAETGPLAELKKKFQSTIPDEW